MRWSGKLCWFSFGLALSHLLVTSSGWATETSRANAFCIDFNWGPGGPNGFAAPGLWAEADPAQHVAWYAKLGANVIQTFAVSCNGYAWYKGGTIPAQPGLKSDFLPEVVRLGHQKKIRVMGYFCVAANTRWGQEHPDLSYGTPSTFHLPLTDAYLDYLSTAIEEALLKSGMDGFMVDWLWNPSDDARRDARKGEWLEEEKKLFTALTGKPFPTSGVPAAEHRLEYERKAIDRCWRRIHDTAKRVKPDCVIWLSCYDVRNPQLAGTSVLKEVDWMMDESGTPEAMRAVASQLGPHTRPMLCLVGWGDRHDARRVLSDPENQAYDVYGFAKPGDNSLPLPIDECLSKPIDAFQGNDRNIAALARYFNGKPFPFVEGTDRESRFHDWPAAARPVPDKIEPTTGKFKPDWDSLRQYRCPDWFRDAKLGIWAVWGPESVPQQGDWYARQLYLQGHPQYNYHVAHYGHPSQFGYKDIIPLWKAEEFDPDRLMALYKKAGAKYFCVIAQHHDNYDCWDSQYHRWNSVNIGPKRDIVAEWKKAADKYGLRFGVTEHLAASWSWYSVTKGADKTGPLAHVQYDGTNVAFADLYHPDNAQAQGWYGDNAPQRWKLEWYYRVRDLVDRYQPDLLYSDGPLPYPDEAGRNLLAHFYNGNYAAHQGQLEAVYNCKQESNGMWVQDLERGIMGEIREEPWQTDTCVGGWYYDASLFERHAYKSATTVIQMLADIVSKNGNLLLNFPPRPDGTLDADEEKILSELAAWMEVNGQAIFGTRPWKVFGEGARKVKSGGFNEGALRYTARDIRFTTKGQTLYAIALGWPESSQLLVRSLAAPAGKIMAVELLGAAAPLQWSQTDQGLAVQLPRQRPCEHAWTLKITGHDLAPVPLSEAVPVIRPGGNGRIVLQARDATLHGDTPQYEYGAGKDNIGFWGNPRDFVSWTFAANRPGRYAVEVTYSCDAGAEGSQFTIGVGSEQILATSKPTGNWASFRTEPVGIIRLDKAGPHTLEVRPRLEPAWKVIGLQSVVLKPEP